MYQPNIYIETSGSKSLMKGFSWVYCNPVFVGCLPNGASLCDLRVKLGSKIMRSSDDLKTWKTMVEVGLSFFMCGKIQINQSLVIPIEKNAYMLWEKCNIYTMYTRNIETYDNRYLG